MFGRIPPVEAASLMREKQPSKGYGKKMLEILQ
jgi:hypothetical protein